MMAKALRKCSECGYGFDAKDERASLSETHGDYCPICALFLIRGTEAWALRNDCQGVFEDTIHASKAGAESHLKEPPYSDPGCGCYVVPVRIYEEPENRVPLRMYFDRQRHGAPEPV